MGRSIADLPGPRRLPVLGNAHQIRTTRLHVILENWARRHGPVFRFDLGPNPVVVFGDPAPIAAMLRARPDTFRRWTVMGEVIGEMGIEGPLNAEGDAWRRQRRLSVTALNTDHLHRFYDVIARSAERLHGRLGAMADGGDGLNIRPLFQSFTVDVTSALAFGEDINTLEGVDPGLQEHIDRITYMVGRRMNIPVPYWRRFKLPVDRELDRSLAVLNHAVSGFIERGRKRRAESPDREPDTFLEGLLASSGNYTDREIAGNVFTMLAAGEDTTANSLAWAAWYLAVRPDVQEQVANEAAEVFGASVVPTYEQATELAYTEAVVRETIRIRSASPLLFLEPLVDTEAGGVNLPAGTQTILLTRYVALQEDSYVRPKEFDPTRWLGGADPKHYLAFGAGPRACPGRNLAHLEAKTALAVLANSFEITLDPDGPAVYEEFGFTAGPSAVPVRLKRRVTVA